MSEPEEITTMSGQKLPLKMSVDYISFSAHTDYQQTSEFIRALKPPHVVSLWIWFLTLKGKETYPRNSGSWFSDPTLLVVKVAFQEGPFACTWTWPLQRPSEFGRLRAVIFSTSPEATHQSQQTQAQGSLRPLLLPPQ